MHGRTWTRGMAAALAAVTLVAGCGGGDDDPPEADADAIVYVALGDSFSSGEGAPPYDPASGSCNVSALAWPRLLYADTSEVVSVDHRACAGAKAEHMTGPWESRDLAAQIPTEPDPTITLVTLTIGGNNAGFGDIVGTCVVTACPSPEDEDFVDALAALTDTLVTTVYPALRTAYPEARLVHVGYPRLTPAPGQPVDGCAWLDEGDQVRAAGILTALDDTIRAATEESPVPVEYADVTDALDGHELCTPRSWLNPIGLGTGHAHPNAAGQRGIEEAVAAALGIDLRSTAADEG